MAVWRRRHHRLHRLCLSLLCHRCCRRRRQRCTGGLQAHELQRTKAEARSSQKRRLRHQQGRKKRGAGLWLSTALLSGCHSSVGSAVLQSAITSNRPKARLAGMGDHGRNGAIEGPSTGKDSTG